MDVVNLSLLLHYLNILSQTVAVRLNILKINKTKPFQDITCVGGSFIMTVLDFTFIVANLTDTLFMLVDIWS